MTGTDRVEHYQHLKREAIKAGRWFTAATLAMGACLVIAAGSGPADGWPWLAGAIGALGMALWALIDMRHNHLLIALHMLPYEIKNAS